MTILKLVVTVLFIAKMFAYEFVCPGETCKKDESKCLASICSCKENHKCTCQQNEYYTSNPKNNYILSIYCKNHVSIPKKTEKKMYRVLPDTSKPTVAYRRTNYTIPSEFSLIPNITISYPMHNKCWADGTCLNNTNPNKADVFGKSVAMNQAPIKIPGPNGVTFERPNSPEYMGRFSDPNKLEYECGDGTEECEFSCCSYGFCIDPTNECSPYTATANYYSLYTFISLAGFFIVYWVLFWYFGVEYAKQATIIHPDFSRDKIQVEGTNIMQQNQHISLPNKEIDSKNNSVREEQKTPNSNSVSLSGGIFPGGKSNDNSLYSEKKFDDKNF